MSVTADPPGAVAWTTDVTTTGVLALLLLLPWLVCGAAVDVGVDVAVVVTGAAVDVCGRGREAGQYVESWTRGGGAKFKGLRMKPRRANKKNQHQPVKMMMMLKKMKKVKR